MNMQPRSRMLALVAVLALPVPTAALAETISVKDVTLASADGFTMTIPSIEATDASLDEAGIRALFSTDYEGTIERLVALDAAAIDIPEISIAYTVPAADDVPAQSATIVYRDLALRGVEDGVATAGASIGGIEVTGQDDAVFTVGRMSASLLDLGGIIGFYGLDTSSGTSAMKPLYRNPVMDGITFGDDEFSCSIGRATAEEFRARPLKHSFSELMSAAAEIEAAEKSATPPSPETIARLVAFYADFLTAFESTPSTVGGMECTGTDEGRTVAIDTGDLVVDGFAPGIYPQVALNDFKLDIGDEGWLSFGNFTVKQTDVNAPIAALTAAAETLDKEWFEANWRKLIPAFAGLSLERFAMDMPDEGSEAGERIAATIAAIDVSLADYVNGIPSNISTSGSGIEVALPDGPDGDALRALGLGKLNLGYDFALHWNEAAQTISVDKVAINGEDLGRLGISGTIANAAPELFNDDFEVATAAAMALTVHDITIDVENAGIAPTLIALAAADQNMPADAFYLQLAGMARALPLALLGATDEALGLSEALGAFLSGTPELSITLTSVDPKGIGLAEFMAAQDDPSVLKGKFTIAATTAGEPVPFEFPALTPPAAEPPAGEAAPAAEPSRSTEPATRDAEKQSGKN